MGGVLVLGTHWCSWLKGRGGMAGGKERLILILLAGIIPTRGCPRSYPSGAGRVGGGSAGGMGVAFASSSASRGLRELFSSLQAARLWRRLARSCLPHAFDCSSCGFGAYVPAFMHGSIC